jgi:hypothetical protein
MNQVHKENLTHVENANPGRQGLEIEIFGMEGVPAEIIDQHNHQVTQAHFAEEAERARLTGNPVRGSYANGTAPPNKRKKVTESLEEIEARADKYREDRKNGVLPLPPATTDLAVDTVCYSRQKSRKEKLTETTDTTSILSPWSIIFASYERWLSTTSTRQHISWRSTATTRCRC